MARSPLPPAPTSDASPPWLTRVICDPRVTLPVVASSCVPALICRLVEGAALLVTTAPLAPIAEAFTESE